MRNFTIDQATMLTESGYQPGWMKDLQEDDEIAFTTGPSFTKSEGDPEMFMWRVTRVEAHPRYTDVGGAMFSRNLVQDGVLVSFIAWNDDGIPLQQTYGGEWPCFIRRSEVGA